MPKKGNPYPKRPNRVDDAATLQQRITDSVATADEEREYRRVINALRAKFRNGQLSPENARRLGID
jgi:hypothetical protein